MRVEIRADGAHISGYVNATEKKSRPVITPHGKVIEVVESRAFERAIARASNIEMTVDHEERVYASTAAGTLKLYEDGIGLYADSVVTDGKLVEAARQGKIKGWSFGMKNVSDEIEQRAGDLPIRHIKALDLDHITLVVNKCPVYSATSVEVRADEETEIETRAATDGEVIIEVREEKSYNSAFHSRFEKIKTNGRK